MENNPQMEGNQHDLNAVEEEEEEIIEKEHFRASIESQDTQPIELITIHNRRNTTLPVIEIRDGFKNYGYFTHWRQVIKECNLKANNGQIYAILGPHASGKTTILHLLLGLTRLNHGEVEIFGYNPTNPLCGIPGIRVGFSPQKEGLYLEFTIDEILRYYASILRLTNEYLNRRISFLTDFLSLPKQKHTLKLYDDNIRRRVSFAISILHEPQLLILDEPTRGISPAIRNSIWEHLLHLSNEKDTTIIVATANSIEAEFAHRVGILREGRIIIEGRPKTILDRSSEKSLDTLYTRLYSKKLTTFDTVVDNVMKQAITITPEISEFKQTASEGFDITALSLRELSRPKQDNKRRNYVNKCDKCKRFLKIQYPKFHKIVSVSKKNLLIIVRNFSWSIYFLLVTLSLLVLFYNGIGHEPRKLPVGFYNGEIQKSNKCQATLYSCQIMFRINTNIIEFTKFNDENSLLDSAKNGELNGYIIFPKDFTQSVRQELASDLFGGELKSLTELTFIKISLDLTNVINAFEIEKEIRRAEVDFFNKIDLNEEASLAADYPLKFMEPMFGTKNTTYSEYVGSSLIVCWPVSLSFTIVVAFYMTERERNLHQMSYLIGINRLESIIGYIFSFGIILILYAVVGIIILLSVCNLTSFGSIFHLLLIIIAQIIFATTFGLSIAKTCKSWIVASSCLIYVTLFCTSICGIIWPLAALPKWLQITAEILPLTHGIRSGRNILQKGFTLTHANVFPGFYIPLLYSIVNTIIILFLIKCIPEL